MKISLIIIVFFLSSCSREQSGEIINAAAKTYNRSYKDNVIKNYQAKVLNTSPCAEFKSKFKVVGEPYESAASGMFAQDMSKIWESAKAAGCAVI